MHISDSNLLLTCINKTDDTDRNRKSITHVATTEKRIHFREVQLKPKTDDASKQDQNTAVAPEIVIEQVGDNVADVAEGNGGGDAAKGKRKAKGKTAKGKGKSRSKRGKEKEQDPDVQGDVEMEGTTEGAHTVDAMNVDEG
jgi:hypothetical protein